MEHHFRHSTTHCLPIHGVSEAERPDRGNTHRGLDGMTPSAMVETEATLQRELAAIFIVSGSHSTVDIARRDLN